LTRYMNEDKYSHVKDVRIIATKYIKGMFIFDLLATFPSRHVFYTSKDDSSRQANQLMFMLKLLRLPKLGILWDTKEAHKLVKTIFKAHLDKINRNDN
jgi:hypothetical protein